MKVLKQSAIALAIAGVGLTGVADAAPVRALATSILKIGNLQFIDKADGALLKVGQSAADLLDPTVDAIAVYTTSSNVSAGLNGTTATDSDSSSGTDVTDAAIQKVGGGAPIVNNTYPIFSTGFGDPAATFAAADQNGNGFPVAGFGNPLGANENVGSWVNIDGGTNSGTSSASEQLSASVLITPTRDLFVSFQSTITAYLEAFISGGSFFPTNAKSSYSYTINVLNTATGNTVFNWAADGNVLSNTAGTSSTAFGVTEVKDPFSANDGISKNAPLNTGTIFRGAALGVANTGSFEVENTNAFLAGITYQLTATIRSEASAETVPEPSVLALLGAGLIGLGRGRFARKTVSAA